MRLNPDCIRDILLKIEDLSDYDNFIKYPSAFSDLNYEANVIIYHIQQCNKSGLIEIGTVADSWELIIISDLTPLGHEFLANTRENKIWKHTKNIAEKVGSKSLDTLTMIASNVIAQIIKSQLGIV